MGILNKLFRENNKEEKAEEHFKKSLEHLNFGDFELGINELNKAIELNPTSSIYYYNRGTAKKMMLNYKEAIPDLTKSIELNFNKAENAYFNRALSRFHTKDIAGAKLDNQKAKALGYRPQDIEELEEWIIEVEDIGYDKFIKQWD